MRLFFSWLVQSEPAVKGTAVSSFGVCMCHWYRFGVNFASDIFPADFTGQCMQNFPSHPPQYLFGICVTDALGPYFHVSITDFTKLFWSGDAYFDLFSICTSVFPVSLFRKFGIVLKLLIVRVVQG